MSKKKIKLFISLLIFILGAMFSIFFTTLLHNALSGKITNITFPGLKECIGSLRSSKQHLRLFLYFLVLSLLGGIGFYFSNNKAYQSKLIKVTPNIYTPVPAGQNQYGSARWLTEKEKGKVFKSYILNPNNAFIKKLILEGYKDLEGGEDNQSKLE